MPRYALKVHAHLPILPLKAFELIELMAVLPIFTFTILGIRWLLHHVNIAIFPLFPFLV